MNSFLAALFLGLSLLMQSPTALQEQKHKSQTISTEPNDVVAELIIGKQKILDVRGMAIFTPTVANPNDTLNGTLTFRLSEIERRRVAAAMKKSLSDIPSVVKKEDVPGIFEKQAKCPDIRFEFSSAEVGFVGGRLRFRPFLLSFRESPQELAQVLCRWGKTLETGRGGSRGMAARFNLLLKGEVSDK